MNKSLVILTLSMMAFGATWWPLNTAVADPTPTAHHHGNACADACAKCANMCSSCAQHCLQQVMAGKKEHAMTLRLCADCADLCSLAAKVESRGGPLNLLVCEACAEACDQCAAECNEYKDQPHMAGCAKSCMACAAACRDMIQHAGHSR